MTLIRHTLYMTLRHLRELWRQPWFVAVTLVQPVIWLLLFGELAVVAGRTATSAHPDWGVVASRAG